ncbi:uncharacterized protein BP5553_07245 [Venustampulla echinocandica]|uniref:Uncharacterized protein n=1 Tax=Venustampulla echinocandica TaxID=2656787 RepID=A0A370TIX2_9HELO|nr:uncharacterized protein BP5553_07245 [Venustampulla echinocandica]RDL35314.1 hypothetical protein BP5553_07245 [Venustampulla echinocandica]
MDAMAHAEARARGRDWGSTVYDSAASNPPASEGNMANTGGQGITAGISREAPIISSNRRMTTLDGSSDDEPAPEKRKTTAAPASSQPSKKPVHKRQDRQQSACPTEPSIREMLAELGEEEIALYHKRMASSFNTRKLTVKRKETTSGSGRQT